MHRAGGTRDRRGQRKIFTHTPPRVRAERAASMISTRIAEKTKQAPESASTGGVDSARKDAALFVMNVDVLRAERQFVLAVMRDLVDGTELSPDQKIVVVKLMIAVLIIGMLCACIIFCFVLHYAK
jgi:hypothetical protein